MLSIHIVVKPLEKRDLKLSKAVLSEMIKYSKERGFCFEFEHDEKAMVHLEKERYNAKEILDETKKGEVIVTNKKLETPTHYEFLMPTLARNFNGAALVSSYEGKIDLYNISLNTYHEIGEVFFKFKHHKGCLMEGVDLSQSKYNELIQSGLKNIADELINELGKRTTEYCETCKSEILKLDC